jgi:putative membrane protein
MTELPLSERAALIRTRLALERNLMAWTRTAISLISFGFTLFKALEYAHTLGIKRTGGLLGASGFALLMIVMGLVALVLATIQHVRHARTLQALDPELPVFSEGTLLGTLFALLGLVALLSALFPR